MRTLHLQAEHDRWPVRVDDGSGDGPRETDPASLPIAHALSAELVRWALDLDATHRTGNPHRPGFADTADATAWLARGDELANRLRRALPVEEWTVTYAHAGEDPRLLVAGAAGGTSTRPDPVRRALVAALVVWAVCAVAAVVVLVAGQLDAAAIAVLAAALVLWPATAVWVARARRS